MITFVAALSVLAAQRLLDFRGGSAHLAHDVFSELPSQSLQSFRHPLLQLFITGTDRVLNCGAHRVYRGAHAINLPQHPGDFLAQLCGLFVVRPQQFFDPLLELVLYLFLHELPAAVAQPIDHFGEDVGKDVAAN